MKKQGAAYARERHTPLPVCTFAKGRNLKIDPVWNNFWGILRGLPGTGKAGRELGYLWPKVRQPFPEPDRPMPVLPLIPLFVPLFIPPFIV